MNPASLSPVTGWLSSGVQRGKGQAVASARSKLRDGQAVNRRGYGLPLTQQFRPGPALP
jgi:hypothetical protein